TPDIQIPLFEVTTKANNINLNFTMRYDLAAASSAKLSSGYLGGSWSLDVFAGIYRNTGMLEEGYFRYRSDEEYYEYYATVDATRASDLFSFNTPIGISGKFKLKRNGNELEVDLHGSSQNIDMDLTYSSIPSPDNSSGRRFRIDNFTVIDDYGYKYIYANYDSLKFTKYVQNGGSVDRYFRTHYYITSIKDKYDNDVLTYQYSTNNNNSLAKLVPEKIIIHDKGYI